MTFFYETIQDALFQILEPAIALLKSIQSCDEYLLKT